MESVGSRFNANKLVRQANSLNSVSFKDRTGEIELFGEKAILLRRDTLKVIKAEIERNAGSATATMIMRLAGRSLGAHEGTLLMRSARNSGYVHEHADFDFLVVTLEELNVGFGKIILLGLDHGQNTARLRVDNCFEAVENGADSKEPCLFTAGFLEGLFSEVLDNKVKSQEISCWTRGASTCEFSLAPSKLA